MSSYLKTKETDDDVRTFLDNLQDKAQQDDSYRLVELMTEITDLKAKLWGSNMIGFGKYAYKTKAGKVGEWFLTGFSPRKNNISLHLMFGLEDETDLLNQLGRHTIGKGCLYIKKLSDVDESTLKKIIERTFERMKKEMS